MLTVDLHEAQVQLSQLIEMASRGEPVIISQAGQPLAQIVSLIEPVATAERRLGFLQGQIIVPDDFNQMGSATISTLFGTQQ